MDYVNFAIARQVQADLAKAPEPDVPPHRPVHKLLFRELIYGLTRQTHHKVLTVLKPWAAVEAWRAMSPSWPSWSAPLVHSKVRIGPNAEPTAAEWKKILARARRRR